MSLHPFARAKVASPSGPESPLGVTLLTLLTDNESINFVFGSLTEEERADLRRTLSLVCERISVLVEAGEDPNPAPRNKDQNRPGSQLPQMRRGG